MRFSGINPDDPVNRPGVSIPESVGTMTELQYRAAFFIAFATWQQWNNLHYQYELGFMPEDSWARLRLTIKRNFADNTLTTMAYAFVNSRPSFRQMVEEIIAEVETGRSE